MKSAKKTGAMFILGAGVGYLASLLVSDKVKKKQTNDIKDVAAKIRHKIMELDQKARIKDIFGSYSEDFRNAYQDIVDRFSDIISEISESVEDLNKSKYKKLVDSMVSELKNEGNLDKSQLEKIQAYLTNDYMIIKDSLN